MLARSGARAEPADCDEADGIPVHAPFGVSHCIAPMISHVLMDIIKL